MFEWIQDANLLLNQYFGPFFEELVWNISQIFITGAAATGFTVFTYLLQYNHTGHSDIGRFSVVFDGVHKCSIDFFLDY